jgi:hypothetical protein
MGRLADMRQGERTDFKAWLDRLPRVQPRDRVNGSQIGRGRFLGWRDVFGPNISSFRSAAIGS